MYFLHESHRKPFFLLAQTIINYSNAGKVPLAVSFFNLAVLNTIFLK